MSAYTGTAHVNRVHRRRTLRLSRSGERKESVRVSRNLFLLGLAFMIAVFALVGLSAYAASIQHENNLLAEKNAYLQAEIDSLNSQIVEETKVTRIEKLATKQYGMVYPTSENTVYISEDAESDENLAQLIRSEAYN